MRKPPDTSQGPTWAPQSVISNTPYVVRRQLGQGGMGSVYEVQHADTRRLYAFKVLSTRVAEHPALAERVVREAEFLGLVKGTPHVVTVVEWGRLRDAHRRPFLVMERLYGDTLDALLSRRSLPLTDALSYIRQVLWGVAAVHGAGGLHRDVKPSNLFVQQDGTCTLLDFGVMKALSEIGLSPRQFCTAEGVFVGTPSYMAPEVASHGVVDHRADLFSVGLVLAECLLGFRLLAQLSEPDYLTHLVNEGVPSIELSGGAHLPAEVCRLVRRATMFDPARRFSHALAFLAEVERVAGALGLRLHPIPPRERLGPGAQQPPLLFGPDASARPTSVDSVSPTRVDSVSPTRVDSVSPTGVKTPAPASGAELTPPLESQRRLRWRGFPWGRSGPAPGSPTPVVGPPRATATTLPLPPGPAAPGLVSGVRDRLVLLPGWEATPVDDVLEGPAPVAALAALEPPAEPEPAARPRGSPLASALALGAVGVAVGAVASLAMSSWVGPPAVVVRASPERLRPAPAGVIAPAPSAPEPPPHEASAEPKPPEASPPAKPPSPRASSARGDRRAQLEAKLQRGQGTMEDVEELVILCFRAGDEPCVRRAQALRKRLAGPR